MKDYREVTDCRLCDSLDLEEVLNLGETPLANELDGSELFPLVVMRCKACSHHQLSIAVAPERLWGPSYPYQSGTSPAFRTHLAALADEIAALKPGGHVLEIASNDGTLVRMLDERGMRAVGVDPSGPQSFQPTLLDTSWPLPADFPKRYFDVIVALNVFAHVDDLHAFTAAVKEALAPDGVFIVEVGYLPDVIERGLFDVIYHEHMSYHSFAPLAGFFYRHGLEGGRAVSVSSQGGSVRLYLTHATHPLGPQLPAMNPDISKLETLMQRTSKELLTVLPEHCSGYGAPAKLTTMMYGLQLEDAVKLDCVFDDNPLKVGRTTPGMHVPIVPSSWLLKRNPETLLLFSWNFAAEIIPRLRAQGYKGRIVVPLPEVKVYE